MQGYQYYLQHIKNTHIIMITTQKTLDALIYTLGVLLAGSLGALLMFLVIDV